MKIVLNRRPPWWVPLAVLVVAFFGDAGTWRGYRQRVAASAQDAGALRVNNIPGSGNRPAIGRTRTIYAEFKMARPMTPHLPTWRPESGVTLQPMA
jgi:hypothetical protein